MENQTFENENMEVGLREPAGGLNRANPAAYLERPQATILMVIKLLDGLTLLCFGIVSYFFTMSIVKAVNNAAASGVSTAAVIIEWLKDSGLPKEGLQQASEYLNSGVTIRLSSKPVLLVFACFLPLVIVSILEAVAAIRLRFGKGGTTIMGVLHRIRFVLRVIIAVAAVIATVAICVKAAGTRQGGSIIMLAILSGILFVASNVPGIFYHDGIARAMKEIRYEMTTGERAAIRPSYLGEMCIYFIAIEGLGIVSSMLSTITTLSIAILVGMRTASSPAILIAGIVMHLWRILKYVCVMISYRNFRNAEGPEALAYEGRSHKAPAIIAIVITVLFALPTIFLSFQTRNLTATITKNVETFLDNAEKTFIEVGESAKATVEAAASQASQVAQAAEAAAGAVIGTQGTAAGTQGTAAGTQGTAAASDAAAAENKAGTGKTAKTAETKKTTENKTASKADSASGSSKAA